MRQCSASAATSPAPIRSAIGHRLVDRGEALGRVLDVEQGGVAAHQGGGERAVVADAARHRHRLGAEPRRPVAGAGEREVLGQAREQPRPQRALGVPERGERLLEPGDVGGVGGDRHVEAPAGAERGAGQDLGVAGDLHRLVERRAGAGLAGLPAHVAEGDQEVGPPVDLERLPEVPGRLLVGVRGDRLAGGGGAVLDRGLRPADLAGGEEVVGELAGRGAGGLERAAGAQVQADAAGMGGRVVERLAHERVGEGEAIDLLGVLAHDAGAQRLLERVEQLLPRPPHHRLERGERGSRGRAPRRRSAPRRSPARAARAGARPGP